MNMTTSIGSVCTETVLSGKEPKLLTTVETTGGWSLYRTKVWVGDSALDVPKLADGSLDLDEENFPYFWNKSEGNRTTLWSTIIPLEGKCKSKDADFGMAVVAYAEVEQVGESDMPVEGAKGVAYGYEHRVEGGDLWYDWIDVNVDCDCIPEVPKDKTCPTAREAFIQTAPEGEECHSLVAREADQTLRNADAKACVKIVDQDTLVVTITAESNLTLVKNELFLGKNLLDMPLLANGMPNVKKFDYFQCDDNGLNSVRFTVKAKFDCDGKDEYTMNVVAHSLVKAIDANGNVIEGSGEDAYAFEHSAKGKYGFFDFKVGCKCPTAAPTLAPGKIVRLRARKRHQTNP